MRRELSRDEVIEFIKSDEKILRALKRIQIVHPECKFWAIPMRHGDHFVSIFCKYYDATFDELCAIVRPIFPQMKSEAEGIPKIPLLLYECLIELPQENLYDVSEVVDKYTAYTAADYEVDNMYKFRSIEEVISFIQRDENIANSLKLIKEAHPECFLWAVPMLQDDVCVRVVCKYPDVDLEEICDLVKSIYPTQYTEDDTDPRIPLILYAGPSELTGEGLYDISEVTSNGI